MLLYYRPECTILFRAFLEIFPAGKIPRDCTGFGIIAWSRAKCEIPYPVFRGPVQNAKSRIPYPVYREKWETRIPYPVVPWKKLNPVPAQSRPAQILKKPVPAQTNPAMMLETRIP